MCFLDRFYQTFVGEITPILQKFYQIREEERRHPNSFYGMNITLIPIPRQGIMGQSHS